MEQPLIIPAYPLKSCPTSVDLEKMRSEVFPVVNKLAQDPLKFNKWIAYDQNDLIVGMSFGNNVWSMCTRKILMIDFDFKEGFTRETAILSIKKYTAYMRMRGINMMFEMYDTDRGVHAFLVTHEIDNLDEKNFMQVMMDLCNDPYYIGFSRINGYCIRLAPKVRNKLPPGMTLQDVVNKEFTAKPMVGRLFRIGYGAPKMNIIRTLILHQKLIEWFSKQYRTRLAELTSERYIPEIDRYGVAPPPTFLFEVKQFIKKSLEEMGLAQNGRFKIHRELIEYDSHWDRSLTVHKQDNITFMYDVPYGIWKICTPNIAMIDFDVTPEYTRKDFINIIREFIAKQKVQGYNYLFWMYETDRGAHAFVVNRRVDYKSNLANFLLETLSNDLDYINFVKVSSFCSRVGPKIYRKGEVVSIEEIQSEIVSKRCIGDICKLGSGRKTTYISKFLTLMEKTTEMVTSLYKTNPSEMMKKQFVTQINREALAPTQEMFNTIRDKFVILLNKSKLNETEDDLTFSNLSREPDVSNPSRYRGLIEPKLEKGCSKFNVKNVKKLAETFVRPIALKSCHLHSLIAHGPDVPFVFGQDATAYIFYAAFYDILMLDFDSKDGVPKESAIPIMERFINSQSVARENDRLTKSDMCFKMFETDNGVHAFLISHKVPYDSDQSTLMMLRTCSDEWYAAFSRYSGYSVRMSPKVLDGKGADRMPKSIEVINNQFIQRPGSPYRGGRVTYVGNRNNIDPYLEQMVDMIYRIQAKILRIPNLRDEMFKRSSSLHQKVRAITLEEYSKVTAQTDNRKAFKWAERDTMKRFV